MQVIANCGAPAQSTSAAQTVAAQPVAPEFFFQQNANGANPVAATDAISGAPIGPSFAPAKPGEYVALYVTGLGLTDPAIAAGTVINQIAPAVFPVTMMLNGAPLAASDVLYAGAAPGYIGLYQINMRIPTGTPAGNVPIALSIDGASTSPGAFVTVGQ